MKTNSSELNPDTVGWINGEEKQHDKCCGFMDMAIKCALIRENNGLRFGPDVLPSPLTTTIKACPWCGEKTPNDKLSDASDAFAPASG